MKALPRTQVERAVYFLVAASVLLGMIYVGLNFLHWSFRVSGGVGVVLGIGLGLLAVWAVRARGVR